MPPATSPPASPRRRPLGSRGTPTGPRSPLAGALTTGGLTPSAGGTDAAGNTVQYIVHRLCATTGAPHLANCAREPASTNTGGSQTAGGIAPISNNRVYYRVTTRIEGPRRTVAYIQTIIAL